MRGPMKYLRIFQILCSYSTFIICCYRVYWKFAICLGLDKMLTACIGLDCKLTICFRSDKMLTVCCCSDCRLTVCSGLGCMFSMFNCVWHGLPYVF